MASFSASRLERISAAAYDLVANALLGEPSASGLQGQKQEPICKEPFCGGLYWHEAPSWKPEAAPVPLLPMPKKIATEKECQMDLSAPQEGEEDKPQCGDDETAKGAGDEWMEGDPQVETTPPRIKKTHEAMSDYLASKPLDKLDMTGAKFFPALDKPIATRVKLVPARPDEWQWWMANNSVKVMLGSDPVNHVPDFVAGQRDRKKIMDHLTPWLKMDADVTIGAGPYKRTIKQGSQLQTIKPFRKPLRVQPWIGNREQIKLDNFPLEMTFGEPKKPNMEDYGSPVPDKPPPFTKFMGPDNRVKVVIDPKEVGGPPDEKPVTDPMIFPVKRLDVVLRKPREDFKDFLPPLIQAKEPQTEDVDHPEDNPDSKDNPVNEERAEENMPDPGPEKEPSPKEL